MYLALMNIVPGNLNKRPFCLENPIQGDPSFRVGVLIILIGFILWKKKLKQFQI